MKFQAFKIKAVCSLTAKMENSIIKSTKYDGSCEL